MIDSFVKFGRAVSRAGEKAKETSLSYKGTLVYVPS